MDRPVKQTTFCKSYEKKDLPKKKKTNRSTAKTQMYYWVI